MRSKNAGVIEQRRIDALKMLTLISLGDVDSARFVSTSFSWLGNVLACWDVQARFRLCSQKEIELPVSSLLTLLLASH